jgi:putative ABC transport system substrate-binding protein
MMIAGRRTSATAFRSGLVAVLALTVSLVGWAQPVGKVHRIGYLSGSSISANPKNLEAFQQGLRELGWIEGRNIIIEYRSAEGQLERLPELVAELVQLKVDVIAAAPTPAAAAARNVTRTIPIVGVSLTDPVGLGIVPNLARHGGNLTGVSYSVGPDIFGKDLDLLKQAVPRIRRVAVLSNPANASQPLIMKNIKAAAQSLGLELLLVEARGASEFDDAFAAIARERAQALFVAGDPTYIPHRTRLLELTAKSRLPSMFTQRAHVEAGGLMSYGPNFPDMYRRAAAFVDKILKGAKAADLPIEQPTKFELIINLKTARQLGLTIPPSLLASADYVIE